MNDSARRRKRKTEDFNKVKESWEFLKPVTVSRDGDRLRQYGNGKSGRFAATSDD